MKSGWGWTLLWGVLFAACLIAPGRRAVAGNCALYARAETGVALFGAAGGWWDEAAGLYQRGHVPEVGSILVFRRTGIIPSGHVAIVSKVIGPGQILVDQSNWYHGSVTHDTPVIDTSPDHDWTSVAVMNVGSGEFGRDSPTYGFVYPETGAQDIVAANVAGGFDPYLAASRAAYEPENGSGLFHFAVAAGRWDSHLRYHRPASSRLGMRDQRRRRAKGHANIRAAHQSASHSFHTHPAHVAITTHRSHSASVHAAASHGSAHARFVAAHRYDSSRGAIPAAKGMASRTNHGLG
jgi:surface antigen